MSRRALLFFALAAAACGGDEDLPTCTAGQLVVRGTLDDGVHDVSVFTGSYGFTNLGEPEFQATVSGGSDQILLQWEQSVFDGGDQPMRGQVTIGGLVAGNCETGGFPGRIYMDEDGGGFRFVLRDLHASPYCSGAALSGELAGCFRFSQR